MGRRRTYRDKAADLTDRERLLTEITSWIRPFTGHFSPDRLPQPTDYVHWWLGDPVVGDLARAQSSGVHPFTWCYIVSAPVGDRYGTWVVRDIASQRTCHITNDSFYVLRGIPSRRLLWGPQREFFVKVQKAIKNLGDYVCRFRDITFPEPWRAVIEVRPHSWVAPADRDVSTTTEMVFTRRTPIRDIQRHIAETCPQTPEGWVAMVEGSKHAPSA